jgi:hypothetical protein
LPIDQTNAYRANNLIEDSEFLAYVIKNVPAPYNFKLVLKPSEVLKNPGGVLINEPDKVESLKRYLEDRLNAKELKAYHHQGNGRELIHLVFTFDTQDHAMAYHKYISNNSNYSGHIYPTFFRYFLRDGK